VSRPRPPDRSVFTASSRIEVDRHRTPVETWCVMVSIIGQVIADEHRDVLLLHLDLMIARTKVNLCEVDSSMQFV
jgi:hypothetical protein